MTHRERAIAALNRRIPDRVPTFELEFQLAEEMFGRPLCPLELEPDQLGKLSELERDRKLYEMAEYAVQDLYGAGCLEAYARLHSTIKLYA